MASKFKPFVKQDDSTVQHSYKTNENSTVRSNYASTINDWRGTNSNPYNGTNSGSMAMQKQFQNASAGKTAYMPTANATSTTYLDKAYDPLSQVKADDVVWKYNVLTRDGTSYVPTKASTSTTKSNTVSANGGVGGVGGSGGIYGRANFQASDAYNQAMAYTNELLSKLSSGRTSYTDQINALMNDINNRAAFSYDPDNDPLFQQYLASSMESGKTAMTDTMAQASALTGGYGSTYATAAANGAYNNFIQDAYNNLPEYYQTALDTYNAETNNLYNKLGMYNTADQIEYDRLANAYQNNFAMANDIYSKDYSNYWDALEYNTSVDKYNQDLAYKYASLAQDQAQYESSLAASKKAAEAEAAAANEYVDPTPTQYKDARAAYAEKGIEGVKAYVAMQPNNLNVDKIMDDVMTYGERNVTPEQDLKKYQIKASVRGY